MCNNIDSEYLEGKKKRFGVPDQLEKANSNCESKKDVENIRKNITQTFPYKSAVFDIDI